MDKPQPPTLEEYRLVKHFHEASMLCKYTNWHHVEHKLKTHDPEILHLIRDCDSLESTYERRKQTLYAAVQERIEQLEENA